MPDKDRRRDARPEQVEGDATFHPRHYNMGKFEVIDVIEDWKLDFCLGNAIKYIARAPHKGKQREDLRKAIEYLELKLERLPRETSAPETVSIATHPFRGLSLNHCDECHGHHDAPQHRTPFVQSAPAIGVHEFCGRFDRPCEICGEPDRALCHDVFKLRCTCVIKTGDLNAAMSACPVHRLMGDKP